MNFYNLYFKENKQIQNWEQTVFNNNYLKIAVEVLDILDNKFPKSSNYIVGGAVRDLIMGNDFNDIDIATNVDINNIEKMFKTYNIGKNKQFGVVVIEYKGVSIEIAHFRTDGKYSDSRHPDDVISVDDFKQDAARRDITWNAMALDKTGNVIDHFNGIDDIKNKILKMVGDPFARVKEDALRLIRIPRFASRLGFTISPETIEAMKQNAPEIAKVAPERISKELLKMAEQSGAAFAEALLMMDKVGLLQYILPEIVKMRDLDHDPRHHPETDETGRHNVFGHVIAALKTQQLKDPILNLSVLFHDIGKVNTQTIDDQGFVHYLRHAQEADNLIDQLADRLKFDNNLKQKLKFAALNHMKIHTLLSMNNSKIAELMNNDAFDVLIKVAEADARSRGKLFDEAEWQQIMKKIGDIAERFKDKKAKDNIKKVVNGNWVMQLRSIEKPSAEVGRIINTTVDWILDTNQDLADLQAIEKYIKGL